MEWSETIKTAVAALNARRMRSLLTMLGILIGIAAVMLTVGLGQGTQQQITSQINALGSNMIIVSPSQTTTSGGFRGGGGAASTLTTADAAMLADPTVAPDIAAVAPISSVSGSLQSSSTTWTSTVVGTVPDWQTVRAREVASGRFFSTSEVDSAQSVAVIGSETATELFSSVNPIGQSVSINGQSFTVIGVLAEAGSSLSSNEDDTVLVPLTTFANRLSTSTSVNSVSSIYLSGKDADSLSAAYQQVQTALLAAHQVTSDDADFSVSTQASLVETATSVSGVLTLLLGGVAGISLLVGGIGVMNIMLVSVSERVREIGLRKALGATPAVIRRQFLVEAGILGTLGGVLGVTIGVVGAAILTLTLSIDVAVSVPVTLLALVVSLGIGLVAGVYPASRAAKLAPIDALRSE
ncbi:ABC transporter permease [Micropruina sonneratiae]|uniref:ABC transporter permease n=1 Tax=Micropruina sonneratiae TaxID=2986940 RepID=UPI002227EC0B|nr:ABC transporter permease [Micropruina sp. KQZ13P-5]MCW3158070.1 ABC transporter permease [Micropruina sp. KQZ13P-5]